MKIILLAVSVAAAQVGPAAFQGATGTAVQVVCVPVRHYNIIWRHWGFVTYPVVNVYYTQSCH